MATYLWLLGKLGGTVTIQEIGQAWAKLLSHDYYVWEREEGATTLREWANQNMILLKIKSSPTRKCAKGLNVYWGDYTGTRGPLRTVWVLRGNAFDKVGISVRPSWDRLVLPYWRNTMIIVIQLSTRGTVDSCIWYFRLFDRIVMRSYSCRIIAERL